jgi:hypothetical protein
MMTETWENDAFAEFCLIDLHWINPPVSKVIKTVPRIPDVKLESRVTQIF